MFDSHHPPLLTLLMNKAQALNFPEERGYVHHPVAEDQVALCYGEGWTFPVSVEQKRFITESLPLLLVRNKGGVTSEGSTFLKGYAHQFIRSNGQEPEYLMEKEIFPDSPDVKWMLIPNQVNMIWLQYGYKNQHLGGSGYDTQEFHYGKIMIRELTVVEDISPRLDRKADVANMHNIQYRVFDNQILNTSWNSEESETSIRLQEILASRGLYDYQEAVSIALKRAGYTE